MNSDFTRLVLVLGLLMQTQVTLAHENAVVHPGIANEARGLLPTNGYDEITDLYYDRTGDCNDIREGSIKEDNFLDI